MLHKTVACPLMLPAPSHFPKTVARPPCRPVSVNMIKQSSDASKEDLNEFRDGLNAYAKQIQGY